MCWTNIMQMEQKEINRKLDSVKEERVSEAIMKERKANIK